MCGANVSCDCPMPNPPESLAWTEEDCLVDPATAVLDGDDEALALLDARAADVIACMEADASAADRAAA